MVVSDIYNHDQCLNVLNMLRLSYNMCVVVFLGGGLFLLLLFLFVFVMIVLHAHCFKCGRKEGNVLFNDALNTLYLRLYGVGF